MVKFADLSWTLTGPLLDVGGGFLMHVDMAVQLCINFVKDYGYTNTWDKFVVLRAVHCWLSI